MREETLGPPFRQSSAARERWLQLKSSVGHPLMLTAAISLAGTLVLSTLFQVVFVKGNSMAPTLRTGDVVLVLKAGHSRVTPGDVVVLWRPWEVEGSAIKRVLAIGGQCAPQLEEGVHGACSKVQEDQLFVVGDNITASSDSRGKGTVPIAKVQGRALTVIWPRPSLLVRKLRTGSKL